MEFSYHQLSQQARIFQSGEVSNAGLTKVGGFSNSTIQAKKPSKRYFLHYKKGKYYLVNLSLKKKGHSQKYA